MQKYLEKNLYDDFPQIFVDMYGDAKKTGMAFGCDHGNGWNGLLYKLCEDIQAELNRHPEPKFKFTTVKQKLGALVVYHTGSSNDTIYHLIDSAMEESITVCEQCGSTDGVKKAPQCYITYLCNHCRSYV